MVRGSIGWSYGRPDVYAVALGRPAEVAGSWSAKPGKRFRFVDRGISVVVLRSTHDTNPSINGGEGAAEREGGPLWTASLEGGPLVG